MEPPAFKAITYEVVDRIATITFNEPEVLNPMTPAMMDDTIRALDTAAQDRTVRVIVITGNGRAFSAGGDVRGLGDRLQETEGRVSDPGLDHEVTRGLGDRLQDTRGGNEAERRAPGPFDRRAWLRRTQRLILAIRAVEKPVIAAVNGVAAGGGCDIALACDLRVMADTARIGEIFARIGLFPGTGGTWLLPRAVGVEKALELIWTGELIPADEALRIGLVGRVVPLEALMTETWALAARLAEGPPLALALAKAAVYRGLDQDLAAAMDYASTAEAITLTSDDHVEGIRAFREKRSPTFHGR